MKKTSIISSLVIGLIVLLFYLLIYPRIPIITGYAAKTACTCSFYINRPLKAIKEHDLYFSPVNLASISIDQKEKSATADILGLQKQRAVYKPGFGCVLIHGEDNYDIKHPSFRREIQDDTFFPNSSQVTLPTEAIDYVFKDSFRTRALLIMHNDSILVEKYAKDISKETPLLGWSMTKSITNALIGIAIKDSLLDLNDDHLYDEWANDSRQNITLNDLLQMNSGLVWKEDYSSISDVTQMLYQSENIVEDASDNPIGDKKWYYASGTTNLLLGILRSRLANDSMYWTYPRSRLFEPLGMNSMIMETDEAGNFIGSSYGYATARDWLKFGKLFLENGISEKGDTILPNDWVTYSSTPVDGKEFTYGAQWWLNYNSTAYKDVPGDLYSANGFQGQFIFIVPSLDLIVVRLGLNNDFDKNLFLSKVIAGLGTNGLSD